MKHTMHQSMLIRVRVGVSSALRHTQSRKKE